MPPPVLGRAALAAFSPPKNVLGPLWFRHLSWPFSAFLMDLFMCLCVTGNVVNEAWRHNDTLKTKGKVRRIQLKYRGELIARYEKGATSEYNGAYRILTRDSIPSLCHETIELVRAEVWKDISADE